MDIDAIDWSPFETMDRLVYEFLSLGGYDRVNGSLLQVVAETEKVLACLIRLDELVSTMKSESSRIYLPEAWTKDSERQIITLEEGYSDLVKVITEILPEKTLSMLKTELN